MSTHQKSKELCEKIVAFTGTILSEAAAQHAYDLTTNLPAGIVLQAEAYDADRLLRQATATAIARYLENDCIAALDWAAELLEAVNLHEDARKMRLRAQEIEQLCETEGQP